MCTAVSYINNHHLFGRTLDLEHHYSETVSVMPRRYPIVTRHSETLSEHYALIGMASEAEGVPLFYDAVNEHGLCMAALNFPGCACYLPVSQEAENIASFELMPWILGQCRSVTEAENMLRKINVTDTSFSDELPSTPLHWMLADKERCVAIEPLAGGLAVTENPVRVMTNSPTIDKHFFYLSNYMGLSCEPAVNRFAQNLELVPCSRGMGGMGLPGDMSSSSRFVRAAFALHNSVCGDSHAESVSQFFRILGSVIQPRGCVKAENGYVASVYASCCDADSGIYYFSTYDNPAVYCVDMHRENPDGCACSCYPVFHDFAPVAIN